MGCSKLHGLAGRQHWAVARGQLLDLGFSRKAIQHRIAAGVLHPVHRGVYAVGRPELGRLGEWMAAVLACGDQAALSHLSAAALWGIREGRPGWIEVSVPQRVVRRHRGLIVHRRVDLGPDRITVHRAIPVTTPVATLLDLALRLPERQLEAAVNEADQRNLVAVPSLREELRAMAGVQGVAPLRRILDRDTYALTDSDLERRFLRIARAAGLPKPLTQAHVNGFRVDFWWPDLRLVVETDGLRYHRTPAQQARDRLRDQAHVAAGLTVLRFTHRQIAAQPGYVIATLRRVARRL